MNALTLRGIVAEELGSLRLHAVGKCGGLGELRKTCWTRELPGFGTRHYASGRKVYIVQARMEGRTRTVTIGNAEVLSSEGDVTTLGVTRSNEEVRLGDRFFPTEERAVNSTFMPREPASQVNGLIIDVPRGVNQIGLMDVVTINKGQRDELDSATH